MELTKQLLPLTLTLLLAGCNPSGTEKKDTAPDELTLAKSFVQDYAGLQNSLAELETPAQAFAEQVQTDLDTAEESDADAMGQAFGAVMEQLNVHWEAMLVDNGVGGQKLEFQTVAVTAFESGIDPNVTFTAGSTYSMTGAGRTEASGTATVDLGGHTETVSFELILELPAFDDSATGDVSYALNATVILTSDTLTVNATKVGATLNLALGDLTLEMANGDEVLNTTIDSVELGLESLSIQVGGLTFNGAATLGVSQVAFDHYEDQEPSSIHFNLASQGRLTTSTQEFLDSSLSIGVEFSQSDTVTPEDTDLFEASGKLTYAFTTRLKSGGHDFDVSTSGTWNVTETLEEDFFLDYSSHQTTLTLDGTLTISHNGAVFKANYDADLSANSDNDDSSSQSDVVLQDGTVTSATVLIALGDFDKPQTPAYEFGIVKVNGTQYGTLFNDQGVTKASFTDGTSIVVFNGY